MSDFTPSIKLCRVLEKTSATGNTYFVGRLGAARITMLKSRELGDDGDAQWDILIQEATEPTRSKAPHLGGRKATAKKDVAKPQEPWHPATPDDIVPF